MEHVMFVGIDVAKSSFVAAVSNGSSSSREFSNDLNGFKAFESWLGLDEGATLTVAMESTGRFEEALADFCFSRSWRTFVLDPRRVSLFTRAMHEHKTDALDASALALFVQTFEHSLHPYTPQRPHMRALRALVKRLAQLTEMIHKEQLRSQAVKPHEEAYGESLERIIKMLKDEVVRVNLELDRLIGADDELAQLNKLLQSVPGCGPKLALAVLAQLHTLSEMSSAKAMTSWLGLAPRQRQSGTSIHAAPKVQRRRANLLRKTLYMAAVSALNSKRWKPWLNAQNSNKKGKALVIAIMDKLARILFGIVKHQRPFDPSLAFSACS